MPFDDSDRGVQRVRRCPFSHCMCAHELRGQIHGLRAQRQGRDAFHCGQPFAGCLGIPTAASVITT